MSKQPFISIVIINYNGKEFLFRCLTSVLRTNYEHFEVIFIDNNSIDNSVQFTKETFQDSRIVIVEESRNHGVPGGRNIGFQYAKGDFIVFLDNDTEVHRDWLQQLVKVFTCDERIAVAQCKLLKMGEDGVFDHAGDYLTPLGFLSERSKHGVDRGQFDRVEDIVSAKGASTMIRSSVFKKLGMYDDSYFMYLEETDFCLRAWIAGYRVVFAPRAVVWHAYGTALKDEKRYYSNFVVRYYGCRNYIMTLTKNLSSMSLIKVLPLHIAGWVVIALCFIVRGRCKDGWWIFRAICWNMVHAVSILKKRGFIQKHIRRVPDGAFLAHISAQQGLSFYLRKALCYIRNEHYQEATAN